MGKVISLWLSDEELKAIEKERKKQMRSRNNYIRKILNQPNVKNE